MKTAWIAAGALSLWLAAAAPLAAQTRFGVTPDPIDQSKALSTQPTHRLPVPQQPIERLVPERRVFVPELNREVVIPPHYERQLSDQQYQAPPLWGYGARGEGPVFIPGGNRPPDDLRQAP